MKLEMKALQDISDYWFNRKIGLNDVIISDTKEIFDDLEAYDLSGFIGSYFSDFHSCEFFVPICLKDESLKKVWKLSLFINYEEYFESNMNNVLDLYVKGSYSFTLDLTDKYQNIHTFGYLDIRSDLRTEIRNIVNKVSDYLYKNSYNKGLTLKSYTCKCINKKSNSITMTRADRCRVESDNGFYDDDIFNGDNFRNNEDFQ